MDGWLQQLFFTLIPGSCILCEARTNRRLDLCRECELCLPRITNPCRQCGLPVAQPSDICTACRLSPPVFEHCFAPFVYRWPLDRLINDFKSHNHIILGRVLASAMSRGYMEVTPRESLPDILLPVPLHKRRLRSRGFNQSVEIAEVLADTGNLRLDNRLCRRIRDAAPQKTLTAGQRKRNLHGAFTLDREPAGERIAIVDDVVTTAATVSEIGQLLLAHGASRIEVIALARTLR